MRPNSINKQGYLERAPLRLKVKDFTCLACLRPFKTNLQKRTAICPWCLVKGKVEYVEDPVSN